MNTTQVNQEPEVQYEFREMYVSATPKKDIPEKGWRGGGGTGRDLYPENVNW